MALVTISDTLIARMALSHIGASSIESLSDSDSAEANEARTWYGYSLIATLEASDWNFARKRIVATLHGDTISETSNQPLAGVWGFRYVYPGDCVVIRKVQNPNSPPDDSIPFEVEVDLDGNTKSVLTNEEDAVLVYTFHQQDTALYTPGFVMAFSLHLASNMAFALTGKLSLSETLLKRFATMLPLAAASAANEQVSGPPRDADWVRIRSQSPQGSPGNPWSAFPDADN